MNTPHLSPKRRAPARWLLYAVAALGAAIVIASILPYVPSDRWWVRMADFPRLQLLVAAVTVLAVLLLFGSRASRWRWPLAAALGLAALGHAITLFPYRPGGGDLIENCPAGQRVSVLVANVLMTNERSEDLFAAIDALDPDLVLALETNRYWARELAQLRPRYPHLVERIGDEYYGLQLYSRLPLSKARIVLPAGLGEPAVSADLRLRSGESVRFLGLHPKPPKPSQSTATRDAQLYAAGLDVRETPVPAIVAGDFNATPWETTVARMRRIGGLIDPRHGYGYIATFDSKSPVMRWPLDHVLHTAGLATVRLARGREFGSDHFPYFAELCRTAEGGEAPPELKSGDLATARTVVAETQER